MSDSQVGTSPSDHAPTPPIGVWRRFIPEYVAIASGLIAASLHTLAAWPGWMSYDSIAMYNSATGEVPYRDWLSPLLEWVWSFLAPATLGPKVPLLMQILCFWVGVTLVAISLQPNAHRWTRILPLLVLLNPAIWIINYVWRDSYMTAGATLAVGFAALSARLLLSERRVYGVAALMLAAVTSGFAVISRPYLLPVLVLLTIGFSLFAITRGVARRQQIRLVSSTAGLTLVVGAVSGLLLPPLLVGDIEKTRASEAFFALDAYHVDCAEYWLTGERRVDPVSPPDLWKEGLAPCEGERPGRFGPDWTGFDDPNSEPKLSLNQWLEIVRSEPGTVLGSRIQHIASLLTSDFPRVPDVQGRHLVATPAYGANGESVGFPNRGGAAVSVLAMTTAFSPQALYVWALVIPGGVWLWSRRRPRGNYSPSTVGPLLLWPAVFVFAMGALAPSNDARYLIPGALVGWVISLWVVGWIGRERTTPTTTLIPTSPSCEATEVHSDGAEREPTE